MELGTIQTLYTFETEYSADSVEWCPHKPHQNLFVCANYQLIENEQTGNSSKRIGKLLVFLLDADNGLKLIQSMNTSAILDQKWCHNKVNDSSVLAVATADNKVDIYQLNEQPLELKLLTSCNINSNTPENLILSLDWSTGMSNSGKLEIVCSDSKGSLHILEFNDTLNLKESWYGHEFEAWIAGFYYYDTNIVFSGGDDSLFLKFDRRTGLEPVFKNKSHEAGVTSFHSNSTKEYLVASGSYDEKIRLWDIRKMKTELNLIKMPGTLWRLKWDPFQHDKLLAACMLGGVHVVDISAEQSEIIGSYYEHKNIAYGADWSYLDNDECDKHVGKTGQCIIGSCSFYDKLLCISKVDFNT
ncbi:unnamed protein product [Phyllotreta striolata]|uniref:methylated diphthine methylhydrolase n=1 Tax=Phyllotreta striolata TaxID=444603 RepID=A0A9N9TNY9_PHYSR|nr:unnamed protein product [Phyllotreta striolata]